MSVSPDRTVAPASGPIRPYEFPAVEGDRLENGLEFRVARKPDLPLVTAMAVLDAGEVTAPADLPGLAVLTGDALEGGTELRDGRELARALESVGATFGTATGWDSTTVAVSCLADRLAEALPLLAEMIRRPAFEEGEFNRFRAQRLATIAQRRMNPASLASDEFARFLFAEGAVFGRPLGGSDEAVSGISPEDGRGFVRTRYGPANSGLVLVGDLDAGEARRLAEKHFGDWTGDQPRSSVPPTDARGTGRSLHVVHRPGAVQSEIRVGHVGVSRDSPDYFPLQIVNLTLGGSFTSRLNLNLRERHGFTYGVRSRFLARRGAGPFLVSTAVENKVTGPAVAEIHKEIRTLAEDGPTEAEVEAGRSYLAGVFPLKLETTGQLASRIAELLVYDLETDYYRTYRDRIRGVTQVEARAAARRHLRADELCTVVVGDADEIGPALEQGSWGSLVVHR